MADGTAEADAAHADGSFIIGDDGNACTAAADGFAATDATIVGCREEASNMETDAGDIAGGNIAVETPMRAMTPANLAMPAAGAAGPGERGEAMSAPRVAGTMTTRWTPIPAPVKLPARISPPELRDARWRRPRASRCPRPAQPARASEARTVRMRMVPGDAAGSAGLPMRRCPRRRNG